MRVILSENPHGPMSAEELVLFWKRRDGVRCVALKREPTAANRTKLWELRVTRVGRIVKSEMFSGFRAAMRAAQIWRSDFLAD
jgi:hypothetical protein